ncbi:MAG: hypothetical protein GXP62_16275 [Oligoflexia bacterium]|nr:hypothetical protein [Oligoflexia bacterium]
MTYPTTAFPIAILCGAALAAPASSSRLGPQGTHTWTVGHSARADLSPVRTELKFQMIDLSGDLSGPRVCSFRSERDLPRFDGPADTFQAVGGNP